MEANNITEAIGEVFGKSYDNIQEGLYDALKTLKEGSGGNYVEVDPEAPVGAVPMIADEEGNVEWDTISGGSDTFPVLFYADGSSLASDKTYDEVAEAIEAGKFVYGIWQPDVHAPKAYMPGIQYIATANLVYFWQLTDPYQSQFKITYHKANGISSNMYEKKDYFPDVPSDDGTYVLKCVKNGTSKTMSWVAEES